MTSQLYCPVCAAVLTPGALYCSSCGAPIADGAVSPVEVAEEAPPAPEGVIGIDYAGFWMRLLASLVDAIPLLGVNALVAVIVEGLAERVVILVLLGLIYTVGFWVAADGATPGKMAMGIKIVRSNGEPISVGAAILRYVAYYFLPGHLLIGFTSQKRALHDYIAQTVVVRVR